MQKLLRFLEDRLTDRRKGSHSNRFDDRNLYCLSGRRRLFISHSPLRPAGISGVSSEVEMRQTNCFPIAPVVELPVIQAVITLPMNQ